MNPRVSNGRPLPPPRTLDTFHQRLLSPSTLLQIVRRPWGLRPSFPLGAIYTVIGFAKVLLVVGLHFGVIFTAIEIAEVLFFVGVCRSSPLSAIYTVIEITRVLFFVVGACQYERVGQEENVIFLSRNYTFFPRDVPRREVELRFQKVKRWRNTVN